jgi:hypothetical protein
MIDHVFVTCQARWRLLLLDMDKEMVMPVNVIFDLDETVIDSSHRKVNNPDGSIDLVHWRENSTREKIMQDGLLPLAHAMRRIYAAGSHVVICTARPMTENDFEFLSVNNIPYHACLHRQGETDIRPDAQMKIELLTEYFKGQGYKSLADARAIMFDDNVKVIRAMNSNGVVCFDAIKENRKRA